MTEPMTRRPVAAKKRSDSEPAPISIKLPADVVESARIVAAYRNATMSEMLGEMLRPLLAKAEAEETVKRTKGKKTT